MMHFFFLTVQFIYLVYLIGTMHIHVHFCMKIHHVNMPELVKRYYFSSAVPRPVTYKLTNKITIIQHSFTMTTIHIHKNIQQQYKQTKQRFIITMPLYIHHYTTLTVKMYD